MKYAIRSALPDDLPSVLLLLKECGLPFEDLSAGHLQHFQVLTSGESLVGCVGIEDRETDALLRSLVVSDSLRGNGWGLQLLRAIEDHAESIGISALYLLTTTAAPFFEELGYRRIERAGAPAAIQATNQFSLLCPASSTCLFKSISPSH
ncbi:GNAT family N-acetyltransferase [Collimonas pratensis]|uniref:arsenic resistance N-acetyltransferase ArsN2 n=1 Tax=Collimonas pratensis TaxID=279113 RepID=UPI00143D71EC|nr:arsenic resistance N-acetyltransferase ArsN2 [Collimonas pratensis]NKI72295.1 GNAT family N-acetyltransferase [Collimonas pratensis]